MSARRTGVADLTCWGLFREREHSPGRESDDAEILRLAGKHLETYGVQVELRAPEDLVATEAPPHGVFFMCERMEALTTLLAWQERGVRLVNSPLAVLNTYRERMIAQLREANVAFVASRLVTTSDKDVAARLPVWVKRADVHNTQEGDVVFAETPDAVAAALAGLAARGIDGAVLQPHVPGDLIKFYGWRASCARPPPRSASRSTAATPSPPGTAHSSSSISTRGPASRSIATRPRR